MNYRNRLFVVVLILVVGILFVGCNLNGGDSIDSHNGILERFENGRSIFGVPFTTKESYLRTEPTGERAYNYNYYTTMPIEEVKRQINNVLGSGMDIAPTVVVQTQYLSDRQNREQNWTTIHIYPNNESMVVRLYERQNGNYLFHTQWLYGVGKGQ